MTDSRLDDVDDSELSEAELEEKYENTYNGPDPDDVYDAMRDDTSEELHKDIKKIFKFYVEKESGYLIYYHSSPRRFWEHLKSNCEYELRELDEKRNVKKK